MTAFGYKTQAENMNAGQPMGRTGAPRDMAGVGEFPARTVCLRATAANAVFRSLVSGKPCVCTYHRRTHSPRRWRKRVQGESCIVVQ
jgi:hypothetical protein